MTAHRLLGLHLQTNVLKTYSKILVFLLLLTYGCTSSSVIQSTPTEEPTPSIDELIVMFSSPNHNDRVLAAHEAMYYSDDPNKAVLLPYLIDALSGPDYSDRGGRKKFAAYSIRDFALYDETAFNIFTSWVNEGAVTDDELLAAIRALKVFPNKATEAKPGLIKSLDNDDPYIKQAAIQLLPLIGEKDAIPSILKVALSDENKSWVRQDALRALAMFGIESECTVKHIVPLLNSEDSEIRVWAASAIYFSTDKAFLNNDLDWELKDWYYSRDFTKNTESRTGEYIIVEQARNWLQEIGQYNDWQECGF